jgi:predicted metal-dependent phosphoesterase TrpH
MSQPALRLDPHVHWEASYDVRDQLELLLEQATDIGLDGIVVIDHDRISASLRAADHVTCVRERGAVAVVPHPFQQTGHGRGKHIVEADPDGIETYNAWLFTGYRNRRARASARRHR